MIATRAMLAHLGRVLCSSPRCDAPGTARGVGSWIRRADAYRYVEGPPLCPRCSARTWAAYHRAVRERMTLIYYSEIVGYALTRAQLEVARATVETRRDGRQEVFPWLK